MVKWNRFSTIAAAIVLGSAGLFVPVLTGPASAAPALPSTPVSWGIGVQGQLGSDASAGSYSPVVVSGIPAVTHTTQIAAQYDHACAISGGRVYCWGRGDYGQLGNGRTVSSNVPVAVDTSGVLAGRLITRVATGGYHTCVIADAVPFCWGYGFYGQLGDGRSGTTSGSLVPVAVPLLRGLQTTEISTGIYRTCTLSGGTPYCWGANDGGQLGRPSNVGISAVPLPVGGFPAGALLTGLTGGDMYSCLLAASVPYCWGAGSYGQLGNGHTASFNPAPTAVVVAGAIGGRPVTAIDAGNVHACAIAGGKPFCWGADGQGELGNGTINQPSSVPVAVDVSGALSGHASTAISAGNGHTCAIADGRGYCWGGDTNGQAGDGSVTGGATRPTPTAVLTADVLAGRPLTAIVAGTGFTIAIAQPRVPGSFEAVTPIRLLDTRSGLGAPPAHPLPPSGTVSVQITGRGGVPAVGVKAVSLTLTVTAPTAAGYLSAYPDGFARPASSNLNFVAHQSTANAVVVPVGANGRVTIFNGSSGTVQVLLDVAGYFFTGAPAQGGAFGSLLPARLLDTRGGTPVAAGTARVLVTNGVAGVPAGSSTPVVLNVTVTGPTAAGHLTVYCDGSVRPGVSNLNFSPGQTVANMVVTPACSGGRVALFNGSTGSVHLVADVFGYFLSGASTTRGTFGALPPARLLDTRLAGTRGLIPADGTRSLALSGQSGIPATGASAALLTVTVTDTAAAGFLTVYPSGSARPTVSQLNFPAHGTVPNLVVAPIGSDGKVLLYNGSGGMIDLIADVVGYFRTN